MMSLSNITLNAITVAATLYVMKRNFYGTSEWRWYDTLLTIWLTLFFWPLLILTK